MDPVASAIRFVRQRTAAGRSLPDASRVSLHFHPYSPFDGSCTLSAILSGRRYHSQFLTGTSNGGLTARCPQPAYLGSSDDIAPSHQSTFENPVCSDCMNSLMKFPISSATGLIGCRR